MALLESYECPRCGAPLPRGRAQSVVCTYCRATISVEQRVVHRGAVQALLGIPRWVKGELLLALTVGLGIVVWQLRTHGRLTESTPPSPTAFELPSGSEPGLVVPGPPEVVPELGRVRGKLVLASTGQDDQQVVVVVTESTDEPEQRSVAALSCINGQTLWRRGLPSGADEATTERAWVRDSVLVRTPEEVTRLDGTTGEVVWQAPAPEPNGRLCVTEAYVGVRDTAAPRRVLDWATGRPFDVKAGPCETPYSSRDSAPNFKYLTDSALQTLTRSAKAFKPVRGLLPHQGNARVVLGLSNENQESAPSVAVVASGRWVWQQDVSAYTLAAFPEPALAAVRKESVVVPYWDTQNQALRLSAFNLEQGQRLWDASLIENLQIPTRADLDVGMTLDGSVLVRLFDGRLNAYSLDSGKLLWSVGGQ